MKQSKGLWASKTSLQFHHYFDNGWKADQESVPAKLDLWRINSEPKSIFSSTWIATVDTSAAERGFTTETVLL